METGTLVPEVAVGAGCVPAEFIGSPAPLVLDLGCGNGSFLAALAVREPGANIVGVERKAYRVRQATRRTAALPNAAVVAGEADEVLRGLPAASVAQAYLLFSDPWPKRRHASRRLVQTEFLALLASRLIRGGEFFFASDAHDYCRSAGRLLAECGWTVGDWTVGPDWPRTEFEQRFLARGLPVWRLQALPPAMP